MQNRNRFWHFIAILLFILILGIFVSRTDTSVTETSPAPRTFGGRLTTPIPTPSKSFTWEAVVATGYTIEDITMLTPDNGWAVGSQNSTGLILYYNGDTWQVIEEDIAEPLQSVHALAPDDVWTVGGCGSEAIVLHYDGQEWTNSPPRFLENECLLDIDMISASEGWVVGEAGVMLYYRDGIWLQGLDYVYDAELISVDMVSSQEGWALGRAPMSWRYQNEYPVIQPILHFDDNTWQSEPFATEQRLNDLQMLSAYEGWAVGEEGTILYYNDGKWENIASPTTNELEVIYVLSSDDVWIGGQRIALHYLRGDWQVFEMAGGHSIKTMAMTSSGEGWVSGYNSLYRITPSLSFAIPQPTPKPSASSIAYIGPWGICLTNGDGSEKKQVFDGRGFDIRDIAWLPGGEQISFASFFNGAGSNDWFDIYIVNINDAAIRDTQLDARLAGHSWSPDGNRIVYSNEKGLAIYDFASEAEVQVTDHPFTDREPTWSPTDDLVAFVRQGDVYVVNADGSNLRSVLEFTSENISSLTWSPYGLGIAATQDESKDIILLNPYSNTCGWYGWMKNTLGTGHNPSWSADGWITCDYEDRIYVLDFNDGDWIAMGHSPVWQPSPVAP